MKASFALCTGYAERACPRRPAGLGGTGIARPEGVPHLRCVDRQSCGKTVKRKAAAPSVLVVASGGWALPPRALPLQPRAPHRPVAPQRQQGQPQQQLCTASADLPREREVWPGVLEGWWSWEGQSIRYLRSGDAGPALLCVHGFCANALHWRHNLGPLGQHCRAYAVDLLGFGASAKPDPGAWPAPNCLYNFGTWSRQLRAFIQQVVGGPAVLVCNSAGGLVGLQAAVEDPALCPAVQLINCSLRRMHMSKLAPWQRPLVAALQGLLHNTGLGAAYFRRLATRESVRSLLRQCYGDPSAVTDELVDAVLAPALQPGAAAVFLDCICYSQGPLPEELLQAAKVPVSILWGEADPWEQIELGRQLALFPCVQEFIPLPGVGHCPQDEAPSRVNPLILDFVQRYAPPVAG